MANIGITGHRILPDSNLVTSQVDEVLEKIREELNGPYYLYSSLAEGADQLVARRALNILNAKLIVPLPLKKEDFWTDFSGDSRLAFLELLAAAEQVIELPPSLTRAEAYESAGRFILDRIDVLIALWDGKPASGQGGTGQMVAEARTHGLPVAWIHTSSPIPGIKTSASLDSEKPEVTYERFWKTGRKTE